MNKLFISDLVDRMGNEWTIQEKDQKGVKELILDMDMEDKFPMVCFEHTDDSDFDVTIEVISYFHVLEAYLHEGCYIRLTFTTCCGVFYLFLIFHF